MLFISLFILHYFSEICNPFFENFQKKFFIVEKKGGGGIPLRLSGDNPGGRLVHEGVLRREAGDSELDHLGFADAVLLEQGGEGGGAAEIERVNDKFHMRVAF